jgi:ABC-type phosphonate transport system ATPase subunit
MTAPLVQIRGLTKAYYGQRVLSDVSFEIAQGEGSDDELRRLHRQ